ncbi:esterase/lipase family protein [Nocardioides sp. AX2bis]|uniref:esterase/lipase family protein n=1 Tax=Nocardioides sp. AX2bis TaxID=2653157 RepID=UPI001F311361|nr:alpha/beta fold hydrolase [Nocardioides sp. AX2bis]
MTTLRRHLAALLCTVVAAGLGAAVPATAAGAAPYAGPVPAADVSPPGANDFGCRPDRRHPQPVVLVNGTFETMEKNWVTMSPYLADRGYCVFAFNYGNRATGPIGKSARELKRFVRTVRQATDARRVDLVGHSQGGMMPRFYLRFLDGAAKVDDLVGIAPSNHGTEMATEVEGDSPCPACEQQAAGSRFLTRLNRGGDTVPGPDYTVISTKLDEVVTPYQSQFLDGPRRRVTNTLLQDVCPTVLIEHDQAPNDPVTQQIVLDALRADGPARERFQPECLPV